MAISHQPCFIRAQPTTSPGRVAASSMDWVETGALRLALLGKQQQELAKKRR